MAASLSEDEGEGASGLVALDAQGRAQLVRERAVIETIPGEREPLAARQRSLRWMYAALMRSSEPLGYDSLRVHYCAARQHMPDRGWFGRREARRWWRDVGRSNLLRLPGLQETDDGLVYVGVEPSEVSVSRERMRPLEAFRDDPRVEALNSIAETYAPNTDDYDRLLKLWDAVARAGETTTEELDRDYRLHPHEYGNDLADLPHIERSEETFDPSEVSLDEVETLGEMLEMEQSRGEETIRWTYTGPAVDSGSGGSE